MPCSTQHCLFGYRDTSIRQTQKQGRSPLATSSQDTFKCGGAVKRLEDTVT